MKKENLQRNKSQSAKLVFDDGDEGGVGVLGRNYVHGSERQCIFGTRQYRSWHFFLPGLESSVVQDGECLHGVLEARDGHEAAQVWGEGKVPGRKIFKVSNISS